MRIGAFPTAVRTLLPAALVELGRRHPGLELMVTELDPVAVPAALRDRRLDVGLVNDYDVVPVKPDAGLDTVPLLDETVFLAVPPGLRVGADPVRAVRDADWILAGPGTLCHTVTLHVCRTAGFAPRARHHADDFATVLALVAAGQGVSLVPELAAAQPPDGVRLIPLSTRRRTRIAYRQGAATHPGVAAFVSGRCWAPRRRSGRRSQLGHRPADPGLAVATCSRPAGPAEDRSDVGAETGGCVLKVDFAFQNTVVDWSTQADRLRGRLPSSRGLPIGPAGSLPHAFRRSHSDSPVSGEAGRTPRHW